MAGYIKGYYVRVLVFFPLFNCLLIYRVANGKTLTV